MEFSLEAIEFVATPDRIICLNNGSTQTELNPFVPQSFCADAIQSVHVLIPESLVECAHVKPRGGMPKPRIRHQCEHSASDSTIPIQEWVNRLKLIMDDEALHEFI